MAQTGRGITYPASDAHTRLWEHFQTLATTTDSAIGAAVTQATPADSGWVNVSYASGWRTNTGSVPLQVRKIGKVVYIRGVVTNTAGSIAVSTASGYVVANLPAGYIPPAYTEGWPGASQNPGNTPSRIFANPDGRLVVYTYLAATPYVSLSSSYVVAP